jgi:Uma2 family endonuclease
MATATTGVMVPLEVYLATGYRPDRDWIDGQVRERNGGEGQHSLVQKFLINYLSAREQEWGITVYPGQRVQTSAKNYRVPDVCVTRDDVAFEKIIQTPPVLCVEVMSHGDLMSEILERVEDYLEMGVASVWIIDPRRRRAFVANAGGVQQATEELTVVGRPIRVSMGDVFAYLDRVEARR